MLGRERAVGVIFLGLIVSCLCGVAGRRPVLRDDLRVSIASEAAPVHAHLGDIHSRGRRWGRSEPYAVYQHTISWLPDSLDVRTWSLLPERGVNLDLYGTLDAVYHDKEHVSLWGPFMIQQAVYERSLRVKEILDSGAAEYRAISTPRNLLISDCIHAVAAVDPVFGRGHYPLVRVGKPASRYIARQMMTRSVFDQWQYDNSWLIPRLGLDRYPIEVIPPQQIPKRNCFFCRCPE